MEGKRDMLVCEGLKKYILLREGDYVVPDDLQQNIKQGEFVSIIGHSGCGKSTLLTMSPALTVVAEAADP